MANVTESLFGITPEALQAQRDQQLQENAYKFAQLSPMQAAQAGFYTAGNRLGGAAAGLLGAEDPELKKITTMQGILKSSDTTTPEGLASLAQKLSTAGFGAQALQVMDQARQARQQAATTRKAELSVQQEEALRKELADLGPNATEEDILKAVTKYGSADKVLAALSSSASRRASDDARIEAARIAADARTEAAKAAGATALQIAQMRAETAQMLAAMKGPSAAVIKAQERADKIAEGQEGLAGTLSTAKTLIEDIAGKGGMTTTSQGAFANLVTSLGSGTVGQIGGRLVGSEVQSKRDELKSVRLQLLNSIKEATGMSAQQLNSNVELKTWLDSLGADNMTKEANLAIIQNISNRYLKKPVTGAPTGTGKGAGTKEDPIVLK